MYYFINSAGWCQPEITEIKVEDLCGPFNTAEEARAYAKNNYILEHPSFGEKKVLNGDDVILFIFNKV